MGKIYLLLAPCPRSRGSFVAILFTFCFDAKSNKKIKANLPHVRDSAGFARARAQVTSLLTYIIHVLQLHSPQARHDVTYVALAL